MYCGILVLWCLFCYVPDVWVYEVFTYIYYIYSFKCGSNYYYYYSKTFYMTVKGWNYYPTKNIQKIVQI